MKTLICAALVASLAVGCTTIDGNGVSASEVRDVPAFDAIGNQLPVDLEVEVREGVGPEVTLRCDENLLPHIRTRLDGTMLRFLTDDGVSIAPRTPCHAVVRTARLVEVACSSSGVVAVSGELPELRTLRNSGSGGITVLDSVSSSRLGIAQSGSADVTVARYEGATVEIASSGSGAVELSGGRASDETIAISGSGDVLASALEARRAVVRSSGSGQVEVTAREGVSATLSGSGDLTVEGDPPERDERVSGSGRVIYR